MEKILIAEIIAMDKYIFEILSESAWYQGRKRDIDYVVDNLKHEQFTLPNESILKLIEEFIYVELNFKTPDGLFSNIRFNIEDAQSYVSLKMLRAYESVTKECLVPVATIHYDAGVLFMSHASKFYMIHEDGFFRVVIISMKC